MLADVELVSFFNNEISFEGHVEGDENSEIGQSCQISNLEGSDPFQNPGVLVYNLSLLEIEGLIGILSRHFNEGLIGEGGMVYVFLQLEESVHGGTEKLGMAQPVSYVLVFLFGLDGDVVFVAFAVVVVAGDGSVESFFFPFDYVLEGDFLVPGGVGDEPVFVGEGPDLLFMNVPAGEAQIGEVLRGGAVGVEVGIDAGGALLVGAVEFGEGVPDFSLNLEVILEVVDDGVVLLDIGPVVVLVEFGGDVVGGVGVLMRQCGIHFVVEDGIILEHPEVGLFFGGREQLKGVVLVGAETPGCSGDSSCQHYYQYDYYPSIEIYNINSSMLSHKLGLILPRITA